MRRVLPFVAASLLAACLSSSPDAPLQDNPSDPATETFAANLNIDISQMTKTSLGVYYKDLRVGTGDPLVGPRIVQWSYETFLKTGVLVDQQVAILTDLGTVPRGLQDGMVGMQVGGERVIVVPSALAFGPYAKPPIPANATLVYDAILNGLP